jgi:arabinose-5-phosphate isomerase
MHSGEAIPTVLTGTSLKDALLEVTLKRLGMTAIINDDNKLIGIFTDGDLRRALDNNTNLNTTMIDEVMTHNGTTVTADILAAECLQIMETLKINALIVTNETNEAIGALNMHDLLKAGVI